MRFVASLIVLAIAAPALLAGDLTPPAGPPAPTMKTLDQIEARTPLSQQTTPGNANYVFVIDQPGSYYLTRNLIPTGGRSGIFISAEHVTLDLNGFALLGTGAQVAIETTSFFIDGLTIRNGKIQAWNYGILAVADGAVVEDLTVTNCGDGIVFSSFSFTTNVRRCTVYNVEGVGIMVGESSLVSDCAVRQAQAGIQASGGSLISNCTVVSATTGYSAPSSMVRECFALNCTTPYSLSVGSVKSDSFP